MRSFHLLLLLPLLSTAQPFITDDEVESTVMVEDDELKILYFTASWCGPCKYMAPIMKEVDSSDELDVAVYKMDIDVNVTNKILRVSSIPTYIFLKNGVQVGREGSVKTKEQMYGFVQKYDAKPADGKKLAYKPKPSKVKLIVGKHGALSKKNIKKIWYDPIQLNSFANNVYQALNDEEDLKSGLSLAQRSLELDETAMAYMMKAQLEFKLEQYETALQTANKAKDILSQNAESTKRVETLINKIKGKI
ncbi:MAG: thioredoxin family protein [Nonlabens sp.]